MKNVEFKSPVNKVANTQKISDMFREPVNPSRLTSPRVMGGFVQKDWKMHMGVLYKFTKCQGTGDWHNVNTVIGEGGEGLSITAMGNFG